LFKRVFNYPVSTEGKRPLGGQRCKWVDNIKMEVREIGWCGLDLSGS
jgi:hypothetical protein